MKDLNGPLAIVVNQLVPYHDCRFSAASCRMDLSVVEAIGQGNSPSWSSQAVRKFDYVSLADSHKANHVDRLREQLKKISPRTVAIQGWSSFAALTTLNWALDHNARVIVMSESNQYDHPRRRLAEAIKGKVLACCDSALVGSEDHASYLCNLGFDREKISFGYNVVDNEHFQCQTDQPDRRGFVIVSRLIGLKNNETAIRAYADYVRSVDSPWPLKIAGEGPEKSRLMQIATDEGVSGNVQFLGFQSYESLPSIYRDAAALVLPSLAEPWGLVVNESMAAGLAVIASNTVGAVSRLVEEGGNGYLFDPLDQAHLAKLMTKVSGDEDLIARMSARSLKIISDYGPEQFAEGMENAFACASRSTRRNGFFSKMLVQALARRPGAFATRG